MKHIIILMFVAIGLVSCTKGDSLQPSCEQGGKEVNLTTEQSN
tara:strand:- start:568 stop:696 length:129 start_codon:yes stop_codon:yes gene_type:complete